MMPRPLQALVTVVLAPYFLDGPAVANCQV